MIFEELQYSKNNTVVKNKMRELAGVNESIDENIDEGTTSLPNNVKKEIKSAINSIKNNFEYTSQKQVYSFLLKMINIYDGAKKYIEKIGGKNFLDSIEDKTFNDIKKDMILKALGALKNGRKILYGVYLVPFLKDMIKDYGEKAKDFIVKHNGGKYINESIDENIDEGIIEEGVIDIYQKTKNIVNQRLKRLKKHKGLRGDFDLQEGAMSDLDIDLQDILNEYNHGLTETEIYLRIKSVLRNVFGEKASNKEKRKIVNYVLKKLNVIFLSHPKLKKKILNIEIK